VVSYLQLAHDERHPVTGSPVAKVIHNFGRADNVDRAALARLVASISRFLEPGQAVAPAAAGEVEVSTRAGWAGRGCWTGCESGWRSGPRSAGPPPGGGWTAKLPSG
jgi:hypothetical protein